MLTILRDAEKAPGLFHWFGGIALEKIALWMRSYPLTVPPDLLEFWRQTGGGDLFESETMLRPTLIRSSEPYFIDGDDVHSATLFNIQNGMLPSYLAFHKGLQFSAVHLPRQVFVTLDERFRETTVFNTFEEWYMRTLRNEFGQRYGLSKDSESI
jgi:hypothetical protein